MKAIDLFAGIGGLSLGFEKAGIDVVAAFEFWQNAINVYQANFKHPIYNVDLSKVKDMSMFAKYDPDIIIGGPPCQDYSSAGKRDEHGGRADKTIDYANIVKAVRPKIFVMENVDNISKYQTLKKAKSIFRSANYGLTQVVLDASYFNVPQKRKRFFLVGILNGKDDELKDALEKKDTPNRMTVRDYLGNSLGIEYYYRHPRNYNRRGVFSIDEPAPTIRGVNRPVPPGYKKNKNDPVDPSTVRALTTKERSYIQTFPKSFDLTPETSKTNLEQMVGNAVPVNLAYHVGKVVLDYLEGNKSGLDYEQLSLNFNATTGRPPVKITRQDIESLMKQGLNKTQIAKNYVLVVLPFIDYQKWTSQINERNRKRNSVHVQIS